MLFNLIFYKKILFLGKWFIWWKFFRKFWKWRNKFK